MFGNDTRSSLECDHNTNVCPLRYSGSVDLSLYGDLVRLPKRLVPSLSYKNANSKSEKRRSIAHDSTIRSWTTATLGKMKAFIKLLGERSQCDT